MSGVFIRIALRYVVGFLIAKGILSVGFEDVASDPDVVDMVTAGIAVVVGLAVEGWYYLARRFGWST